MNCVKIGWLGDYIVYIGITKEEALERYKLEYPEACILFPYILELDAVIEFQITTGKFHAYEVMPAENE